MPTSSFPGFPREMETFYRGLEDNNNREWFEEHRAEFERNVKEPAAAFIGVLGAELRRFSPNIVADPRTNRSLFRINRDTRFSKDKRPYKLSLAMVFWEDGGKRMEMPGYYVHLSPREFILAAGLYEFPRPLLSTWREAVADDRAGSDLEARLASIRRLPDVEIGRETYKRVPAGYPTDHPRARLLKHGGIIAHWQRDHIPTEMYGPGAVEYIISRLKGTAPLHEWLVEMIRKAA